MNKSRFSKIQGMARAKLAVLRAEAQRTLDVARRDPLAIGATHRAIAAQAEADGYEKALREIVEGMIGCAIENTP